MLTHALKRELLGIARNSIATALQEGFARSNAAVISSPALQLECGAFVTIRIDHELRGCIGYMDSQLPLAEVVAEVAVKAAVEDPRFSPMTLEELNRANLEISILSPLHRIETEQEVKVGEHGVMLELGFNKGVLLPQVALEYGWDAEQLLEVLCRKSGLSRTAWKDPDAKLSVFTAEVINEESVLREHPA